MKQEQLVLRSFTKDLTQAFLDLSQIEKRFFLFYVKFEKITNNFKSNVAKYCFDFS